MEAIEMVEMLIGGAGRQAGIKQGSGEKRTTLGD